MGSEMEPSWCPGRIANFSPRVPSHWKEAFIPVIKKTLLKLTSWFRDNYGACADGRQGAVMNLMSHCLKAMWILSAFLTPPAPLREFVAGRLCQICFSPHSSEGLRLQTLCVLLCCRGPQSCVGNCCWCPACPASPLQAVYPLLTSAFSLSLTHTFLIAMSHCKQT